jgi:hypothetical protein
MTDGGTREQRDFYVQRHFLSGMREAMLEMYPSEDEYIRDWFSMLYGDDEVSREVLLGRTRNVLIDLEGRKNQGQGRPEGRSWR